MIIFPTTPVFHLTETHTRSGIVILFYFILFYFFHPHGLNFQHFLFAPFIMASVIFFINRVYSNVCYRFESRPYLKISAF
jgi:hypothetical protein